MRSKPKRRDPKAPLAMVAGSPTLARDIGEQIDSNPGKVLAVCAAVGEAPFVPPRYRIADCSVCGRACWLNPDLAEAVERKGRELVILCMGCPVQVARYRATRA